MALKTENRWKQQIIERLWAKITCHFDWNYVQEIFKYVRIHPNFTSQLVLCKKMFLCCFFPKTTEKRLGKQAQKSAPLPPQCPPLCSLDTLCCTGCPYLVHPNSAFFQEEGAMGERGGGGGGWVGRENCRPFLSSLFYLLSRKKQHRNICSHRLPKFGWILTYLKIQSKVIFLPAWKKWMKSTGSTV